MRPTLAFSPTTARPSACLVAALIVALTFTCIRRAYAAVGTANHVEFTLSIAGWLSRSTDFTLPVTDSPVSLTAATITPGFRSTAALSITNHTIGGPYVSYAGIEAGYDDYGYTHVGGGFPYEGWPVILVARQENLQGPEYVSLHTHAASASPCRFYLTKTMASSVAVVIQMIW